MFGLVFSDFWFLWKILLNLFVSFQVSVIEEMDNIQVLSLSVNKIDTLHSFRNLSKLRELYLRKNEVKDLSDVCYLKNLKELRVLWLSSNPCADEKDYRLKVISVLPQLQTLDDSDVDPSERNDAKSKNFSALLENLFSSKSKQQPKKKPLGNDSPSFDKKVPAPKLPDLDEDDDEPEEKPVSVPERHVNKRVEMKAPSEEEEPEEEEQDQEDEHEAEPQEEPIIARDEEEEEEPEPVEIPKPAPKKRLIEDFVKPKPAPAPAPVPVPKKVVVKQTPPQHPSPPQPISQLPQISTPQTDASASDFVNKNSILKAILILGSFYLHKFFHN